MIQNILSTIDLDLIVKIAKKAGLRIMAIYEHDSPQRIAIKGDNSAVTLADIESHIYITQQLKKYYPDIPVVSEEGENIPFEVRSQWNCFWIIDPLDGSREFINRSGEFTVNIGLIVNNRPVLGVIQAPALQQTYYGSLLHGAYKETGTYPARQIGVKSGSRKVAVQSRSHGSQHEDKVLSVLGAKERLKVGSSLKFCLVADGTAAFYYRHAPTMEWDTAAGQAIVEAAGGTVTSPDRQPLAYNKKMLRNNSFLCMA